MSNRNRCITPYTDPDRFSEHEATIFRSGKCGYQTACGMPWTGYCEKHSEPGASFGYCKEHNRAFLQEYCPDGSRRVPRSVTSPGRIQRIPDYLSKAYFHIDDILDRALRTLRTVDVSYDTIVGTGLSGALVVPNLGRDQDRYWMLVRKRPSRHHDSLGVGLLGRRWIFVDDQIASGATLTRVQTYVADVSEQQGFPMEYQGFYGYLEDEFCPPGTVGH